MFNIKCVIYITLFLIKHDIQYKLFKFFVFKIRKELKINL